MRSLRFILSPETERGFWLRKGLFFGFIGLAFLFLYVLDLSMTDLKVGLPRILLPFILLVALDLLSLPYDPLRFPGKKPGRHAVFFHEQMPRNYIQARYNLSPARARDKWLGVFRQWKERRHPEHDAYMTSLWNWYECRAVYYMYWLSIRAFALGVIALAVLLLLTWWGGEGIPGFYRLDSLPLTTARIIVPVLLLSLHVYLGLANRPDPTRPTGVWDKWKGINDSLKARWDAMQGS